MTMKARFHKFRRKGVFYSHDHVTGKQQRLYTTDKHEAVRLVAQNNESFRQPALNLQIARAYLLAGDEKFVSRTWAYVMDQILIGKQGNTKVRWLSAIKDQAFDEIRKLPLIETKADHFLRVLNNGTVATNVFLRRLHNFAFEADWIPRRILDRRL